MALQVSHTWPCNPWTCSYPNHWKCFSPKLDSSVIISCLVSRYNRMSTKVTLKIKRHTFATPFFLPVPHIGFFTKSPQSSSRPLQRLHEATASGPVGDWWLILFLPSSHWFSACASLARSAWYPFFFSERACSCPIILYINHLAPRSMRQSNCRHIHASLFLALCPRLGGGGGEKCVWVTVHNLVPLQKRLPILHEMENRRWSLAFGEAILSNNRVEEEQVAIERHEK